MSWTPRTDRGWRDRAVDPILSLCKRTWSAGYSGRLEEQVRFITARIEGAMSSGGTRRMADCRTDYVVTFERVPLSSISVRDIERMEASRRGLPELQRILRESPSYDSVPISCYRSKGRTAVWDGHHRLKAYELAGRDDIPAIVVESRPGTGRVLLSDLNVDGRRGQETVSS